VQIRIEASVDIARPPAEVFAVVADVAHHPDWSSGVERVSGLSDAAVRLGTTWTQFSRIIGREFEVHAKVIEFVPDRRLEYSVDKPARIEMLWRLEPTAAGTRLTVSARGEAGKFYFLVKPMTGALRDTLAADLVRLKKRMEAASA
jgi:uncharacterized protein YndB with AHSA1/START domain